MKRRVQSHGQHYLRGKAFIAELVGHSSVRRHDLVLDFGAGSGAITSVLARRAGRVVAYEVESGALKLLRQNLAGVDNVTIVAEDFLRAELPTEAFKVFSNIPFSSSSMVVQRLCIDESALTTMYLVVQRQFARKLVVTGNYFHGALGMAIAPWWQARIRRPLRRTDFTPPPAVDTVLLEVARRDDPLLSPADAKPYADFVYHCYAEPRFFATTGAPTGRKPSELSLEQWVALFKAQ